MLFTGTNLGLNRSVYTQTGQYGFIADCTVTTTSGRYAFGLSGSNGTLEFKLQSGYLYYQNQFIGSYVANRQFTVEAQMSKTVNNVIKDGVPLIYGGTKPTGFFDTFYFNRDNAGQGGAIDFTLSGNSQPTFTVSTQGYLISTGQSAVTGSFVNTSPFPVA